MNEISTTAEFTSAFVTGATGLLGNNLVRTLAARGIKVRALVRSREKAERQLAGLPAEIIVGDMGDVAGFGASLAGSDVLFHTAAYFRDSFKGGNHRRELLDTNVRGTSDLLSAAYDAGIRRVVHTSSIAVLNGAPGQLIDETMRRDEHGSEDYFLSKILSDRAVDAFLESHPEMNACMVLPGWMVGPGDAGPTSSGQVVLDFMKRKLPGVVPAAFSVVDARDVADASIAAAMKGRRGERYLAAGRSMTMAELFGALERISGVKAPTRKVPVPLLFALAGVNELWARISGRPVLISLAGARLLVRERGTTHFNHEKSERDLGLRFRPVEETLRDTIGWYRENAWLPEATLRATAAAPRETAKGLR